MGAFLLACTAIPGRAQDDESSQQEMCDVRGEIENEPVGMALSVELRSQDDDLDTREVEVMGGMFEFDSIPVGDYRLRVADPMGNVIHEEYVTISGPNDSLTIRLPDPNPSQAGGGIVSVRELRRKVPGNALKELRKSEEAFKRGKFQDSTSHLQRAIQVFPDFLEAYNNLGVCYVRLNQIDKALVEFEKASQLDPDAARVNINLSVVSLNLRRYAEAEAAARRALKSDPISDLARLLLGLSLTAQNRSDDEALVNLQRVEARFPQARLAAAGILARQGHRNQAANELKSYLQLPPAAAEDRQAAEAWLARLQQASNSNTNTPPAP